jgi:hypothetical protein
MIDANDILWEGPQGALIRHRSMGDNSHSTTVLSKSEQDRCFFSGRTYHSHLEFNLTAAASAFIKLVSTNDFCISHIEFEIDDSVLRLQIKNGGTESGTYSTALPIIKSNSMSNTPAVASGMTMTTGGTHSGGNVLMLEKISATKNGALIQEDQLIGLPSGNHFVYIENVGNQSINGLIVMRWSEY